MWQGSRYAVPIFPSLPSARQFSDIELPVASRFAAASMAVTNEKADCERFVSPCKLTLVIRAKTDVIRAKLSRTIFPLLHPHVQGAQYAVDIGLPVASRFVAASIAIANDKTDCERFVSPCTLTLVNGAGISHRCELILL